jgi:act minimal PKS chain-length factor (CLF/KS beta)
MARDVVVTGVGVVSALGLGVDAFWTALVAGRTGIAPVTRFVAPPGALGAEVRGLAVRDVGHAPASRRMDRTSLLALAACRLALADAGEPRDGVPTGLALGSALGNLGETTLFLDRLLARGQGHALVFPNLVLNAPLSYASIELAITGPSAVVTEQEASGEAAIAWGARQVAEGAVERCIAGAADELDPILFEVLHDAGALGAGAPRPLDPLAAGAALGEGAAALVLEPAFVAAARGARVYARLVPPAGFGVPAPVHGWPRDAAPLASRLAPLVADVDAVFAAASGRPALDAYEAAALARALGPHRVAVTATRGAVGDFGAAGALAVAAAVRAVHGGTVPPTPGARGAARDGLDVVHGAARRMPIRAALVDGLARGGACWPIRVEAA